MIPYSYNMVDMGGIDLAEANGTEVPGVYEKIVEAMNLCGDLILYNWKFAGINIAPSAFSVLQQAHYILINGLIQVTELDQITVIGLPPPIVPVSPLEVTENGIYEASPPASGFNPVRVDVPGYIPVIQQLTVNSNGEYEAPEGVDGYSPISVNVEGISHESSLSVVDGEYINTGLLSQGTPYIVDGWFAATSSRKLIFQISPLVLVAEIEFDIIPMTDSVVFSFGGSNTGGGIYYFGITKFGLYAGGTRFEVPYVTQLQAGEEYHMKLVIHSDMAELYLDDNVIAVGQSTYCANAITTIITAPIALLFNQSSLAEYSANKLNNINIKIHMEG